MPESKSRAATAKTKPSAKAGLKTEVADEVDGAVAQEAVAADETEPAGAAVADVAKPAKAATTRKPATSDTAARAAKPAAASTPAKKSNKQIENELRKAEKARLREEHLRRKADYRTAVHHQADAELAARQAERMKLKSEAAQARADKARAAAAELAASPDTVPAKRLEAAQTWSSEAQRQADVVKGEADTVRKRARQLGSSFPSGPKKFDNPGGRQWVVPTFITVGLLGVLWLVVWYITASVQISIPYFSDLGQWNMAIGMGLMASSFALATLWK